MREIKFRAWNGKKMFMPEFISGLTGQVVIPACDESPDKYFVFLIMQYTGLKDKNGKEIYESDRVKTPAGVGVVRWDRCFRLFWNNRDSTMLHDVLAEQLEVIGNIYES